MEKATVKVKATGVAKVKGKGVVKVKGKAVGAAEMTEVTEFTLDVICKA